MNIYSDLFQLNFEIVRADTPELIDEAYRLRYQVYCEEKGYEDAARYPDKREFDEYDSRAIHSLIRHRESGICVGVTRLILPHALGRSRPLPIEQHCGLNLAETHPHLASLPRRSIGEISRFSVSKVFRRRIAERGLIWGMCRDDECYNSSPNLSVERRHLPMISLGLIAASFQMCRENGVEYCYAAMEPTLLRLLRGVGLNFQPLGAAVEYHGRRLPSLFLVREMEEVMLRRPELQEITAAQNYPFQRLPGNSRLVAG